MKPSMVVQLSTLFVISSLLLSGAILAADLSNAQGTVDNIREADPPEVSTTTKESPVGQPVTDYKPSGPSVNPKEPPPPPRDPNPTGDPDVQRGYDQHQKEYGNR